MRLRGIRNALSVFESQIDKMVHKLYNLIEEAQSQQSVRAGNALFPYGKCPMELTRT